MNLQMITHTDWNAGTCSWSNFISSPNISSFVGHGLMEPWSPAWIISWSFPKRMIACGLHTHTHARAHFSSYTHFFSIHSLENDVLKHHAIICWRPAQHSFRLDTAATAQTPPEPLSKKTYSMEYVNCSCVSYLLSGGPRVMENRYTFVDYITGTFMHPQAVASTTSHQLLYRLFSSCQSIADRQNLTYMLNHMQKLSQFWWNSY